MKVLVIHNILWAHYKSVLFEALVRNSPSELEIEVVQIAKNELSRKNMDTPDFKFDYPYRLLFDDYIENIPTFKKIYKLLSHVFYSKAQVVNVTGYAADIAITLAVFFSKLMGKKVVISNESTLADSKRNFLKELIKSITVKTADGYISFGSLSEEYLIKLGAKKTEIFEKNAAIVDDKIILESFLNNNISNFLTNEITTKFNFIFVGRLIEVKNLYVLIEQFSQLKNDCPEAIDWGLILLGDGDLKEQLMSKVKALGTKNVYFEPSQAWFNVPKYFNVSDVLILPSESETWGLVVNEAMICGLPVIVSDKCGCAVDLVDNNGFVFESNNGLMLRDFMQKLMIDQQLRKRFGQKSKKIINKYSVEQVSNRIIKGFLALEKSK
jgi:glycosyltransferase involved in cell wall biosynthesis